MGHAREGTVGACESSLKRATSSHRPSAGAWRRSPPASRGRTTRGSTPSCWPTGDRRNVVDRYRYWRLEAIVADLDTPPASAAGGDPELGARLQHRLDRADRERVQRGRRAHRRPPPLEPSRRHGHRPLPARASTTPTSTAFAAAAAAGVRRWSGSTTCRARCRWSRPSCRERVCLVFGSEGPGLTDGVGRGLRAAGRHHPVRLDPLAQRRRRRRDRDVPLVPALGPTARRVRGFSRAARKIRRSGI